MNQQVDKKIVTVAMPSAVVMQAAQEVDAQTRIIEHALEALSSDPGAIFEPTAVEALREVRTKDSAQYARYRARAKKLGVQVTKLDELTEPDEEVDAKAIDRLIALAKIRCTLCHDADRRGVAVIERDSRREVWMVQGAGFAAWLRSEYYRAYEKGVADTTLKSAIATIEAIGVNDGEEVKVHTRYARDGNAYVVDLCDERWRAIRVDAAGYTLLEQSPVLFTRNDSMRPLPVPAEGGDLELLWKYANVVEAQRPLVLAFLLEAMRPDTAFPVLEIVGEQGSAKSTTHRYLRELIDPSKVPLRGRPGSVEDIYVSAAWNWVVSYENLSGLPAEMQDALCTVSTGGGYSTRKFYTNGEEHVLATKRPVMLNSINGVATRPDLIERTVRVDAPLIATEARREDAELDRAWVGDYPKLLGALLKLLAASLRLLPEIHLPERQRMADFERLGEAMMRVGGHDAGSFSKLYIEAQKEGKERALEAFGVASALADMADKEKKHTSFNGTVGALLRLLGTVGEDRSNWPRTPRGFSDQLKRLAPALRAQGIDITIGSKSGKGRRVTVDWSAFEGPSIAPAATSPVPELTVDKVHTRAAPAPVVSEPTPQPIPVH